LPTRIAKLFKQLPTTNLYLNATNADTSIVVMFSYAVFKNKGYIIAYDKFENTYNLISKKTFFNRKIENSMKIKDFFTLMGYKILQQTTIEKAIKNKKAIKILFKDMQMLYNLRSNYYKLHNLPSSYKLLLKALQDLKFIDKNLKW